MPRESSYSLVVVVDVDLDRAVLAVDVDIPPIVWCLYPTLLQEVTEDVPHRTAGTGRDPGRHWAATAPENRADDCSHARGSLARSVRLLVCQQRLDGFAFV
ncbi:MAG: hypothetical protein J07HB67_01879, partial [halophilic archaeon J07HB67]